MTRDPLQQKPAAFQSPFEPGDLFDIVMDNARCLIFVKDAEGRVLYGNKTFLEMYHPSQRDSIIGRSSADFFSEEEAKIFCEEDRKALEDGFAEIIEEVTDYRGVTKTLQTHKIRFYDKNGVPRMLGICTDITNMAQRQQAMALSNIALENFAAVAAHDLRSPLGAFVSCIELVKLDKETKLSKAAATYLDMMRNSAKALIDQIATLLATYKSAHDSERDHSAVDVTLLLEEVRFNLSGVIQETGARILSNNLPVITADRGLFRQLLHNLIENSIKYRGGDKPVIIIRHQESERFHHFSVEDNGVGMIRDNDKNVFNLYQQRDPQAGIEGYGIGLALCKKIIQLHGGEIAVDTAYKNGCRMNFSIQK